MSGARIICLADLGLGNYKHYSGMTYVLEEESGDFVKVGYTTHLGKRVKGLQGGNPRELLVVSVYHTEPQVEKEIHHWLKREGLHIRGEWFGPKRAVMETIYSYFREKRQEDRTDG